MNFKLKKALNNSYFISFVLGALVYFLFLSYSQVVGGKYIILEGDGLEGTIAGIRRFCDDFWAGNSIAYTWSSFLGINAYVQNPGFSFSTLIYLLLYKFDFAYVTVFVLVIKAGLSSLFFYLFAYKSWNMRSIHAIIFGTFYALCAFQTSYIPMLQSFSDAIFLLPLILYMITEFVNHGKYKLMCLTYLYMFLSFFYAAYIVGFFSLFYMILYMLLINKYALKTIVEKSFRFGVLIVLTAGVSAFILFPTAYFFLTKYSEDATVINSGREITIFDIYNQLFIGQNCKIHNECPYIYCGLPSVILFPFFIINKKINIREKLFFLILLFVMIISCLILPIYLFWHCFDAPDSFFNRFSFIISFVFCLIACKESEYLCNIKLSHICIVVGINVLFYYLFSFYQIRFHSGFLTYPENNIKYLLINLCFFVFYILWFILYKKEHYRSKSSSALFLLIVFLTCSEMVVNGYSAYYKSDYMKPQNNYESYNLWIESMDEALSIIDENDDELFYRINCNNDFIFNGAQFFNYPGITSFSNMENYEVRKALEHIGLATSIRDIIGFGMTDFTRMILSVKYEIDSVDYGNHGEYVINPDQHAGVIKNDRFLSLGFLVDSSIKSFKFSSNNQLNNINELASSMSGEKVNIYDLVDLNHFTFDEVGVQLQEKDDGSYMYKYSPFEEGYLGMYFVNIPLDEREAYAQFEYSSSVMDRRAPFICDCKELAFTEYNRLGMSFICPMTRLDETFSLAIVMSTDTYDMVYIPNNINAAYYNEDEFQKIYDKLKNGQMRIMDFNNGYVHSYIEVNDDNKVLFTSIPYDEGWNIYVNGEKTIPLKLLDGAFIGLELPRGEYDIIFKYSVPQLATGIIISLLSVLGFILLYLLDYKKKIRMA